VTQLTIGLELKPLVQTVQRALDLKDPAARKGAQAACTHQPASSNPYPWDSHRYHQWRLAYFTQHLAYSAPLLSGKVPIYYDHPIGTHGRSWP